jgi:hypothetical protein
VEHGLIARGEECGLALSSARADHTIKSDTVGSVNLRDALSDLVERDVDGARDVASGVLRWCANIDHNRRFSRCTPVVEFGCANAWGLIGLGLSGEGDAAKDGDEKSECESNHVPSPFRLANGSAFSGVRRSVEHALDTAGSRDPTIVANGDA